MMKKHLHFIFLLLLLELVYSETAQKFVYNANDLITVEPYNSVHLSLQLTTTADQYLSESDLQASLQMSSSSPNISYNILYFTYQSQEGQQCYQQWIMNEVGPPQKSCSQLIIEDFSKLPMCCKYTGCTSQNITLTIQLSEQLYRESFLVVQNTQSNILVLETHIDLELSSDNIWFYWGVGLTCLLLISLVIFTGIVFYWMLKYKRVKKMFEQYKLTEENVKQQ